jgi:hypothetical protein
MSHNKDITELENKLIAAAEKFWLDPNYMQYDFVDDLRKIMPPVCTLNDRKFLDEVKGNYNLDDDGDLVRPASKFRRSATLYQYDFETNFGDLIRG